MSIAKYGKRVYRQKRYGRVIGYCLDKAYFALGCFMVTKEKKYSPSFIFVPKNLENKLSKLLEDK